MYISLCEKGLLYMRGVCILAVLWLAVVSGGAANAQSDNCIRELPPKRVEHWSYRIVNGQRCWYPDSERPAAAKAIKSAPKVQAPKAQVPKSAQKALKGEVALATPAPIVDRSEPQA